MIGIRTDKLNYLIALAEEQNITRAAKRLFLSQPALTAYINRLEKALGTQLFDRSVTPIRLTEAGAHYINEMEKLRLQQHQLLDDVKRITNDPGQRLSIGIGRNRGSLWLPRLLSGVYERYPDARLHVDEDRDENMLIKLMHDTLDIAITESFVHNPTLTYHQLADELHCLLSHQAHPAFRGLFHGESTRENPWDVPVSILNQQTFVCSPLKGGLNHYTAELFSSFRITPRKILFISNVMTAYRLALQGVGIAYLASDYCDIIRADSEPLYMMPGGKPSVRKVYLVYSNQSMTPLKEHFIGQTFEAAAALRTSNKVSVAE